MNFNLIDAPRRALLSLVACVVALPALATDITTTPIILDDDNPERVSFGRLTWRGGVSIASEDSRFGGLSALHVAADGQHIVAVTDRGNWLTATLDYRGGNLTGMRSVTLEPIRDAMGKSLKGRWADSESLAMDGNQRIVSFERHHRIRRFNSASGRAQGKPVAIEGPAGFNKLSDNGGIEAMTRLCDGRLLILAEKPIDRNPGSVGWIQSDTGWMRFRYQTKAALRPTGAATLPNCDVVLVERSFSFVAGLDIRVTRLRVDDILPGAMVEPEELAHLSNPLTLDNFEGIGARRGENGETLIYLVSDDNFSSIQRTLLVMFELGETR